MDEVAATNASSTSSTKQVRLQAPCNLTCPDRVDVPRYIGYIARGMFDEAEAVVRESMPFPSVAGRVCYRPCEGMCRRARMDAALLIGPLKRAAGQYSEGKAWRKRWEEAVAQPSGKRVAIVGSGPAGLTAAYYLGKLGGHEVTVFEAEKEPGGEFRMGIPEFRLPRDVLERELSLICENRVDIVCNHRVESIDDLLAQGYDAVFIGVGAGKPKVLDVPGAELKQVIDALDFLHDVSRGYIPPLRKKAVVIGGGNSAIDASRVMLRLGLEEVKILYRRTRKEMPALASEVDEAEKEGVKIELLVAPSAVEETSDGRLRIDLQHMELGEPDESGRRRPVPIPGKISTEVADHMLLAISQGPEVPQDWGLELDRWGSIKANPDTMETNREGIFAGGDVVTGPLSVISAIAQGRQAAQTIDRYLGGDGDLSETLVPPDEPMTHHSPISPQGTFPVVIAELDAVKRVYNFAEVSLGLTKQQAIEEAHRCLRCDLWRIDGVPEVWTKRKKEQPR